MHAVEVADSPVVSSVVVAAAVVDNDDDDSIVVGDTVAVDNSCVA